MRIVGPWRYQNGSRSKTIRLDRVPLMYYCARPICKALPAKATAAVQERSKGASKLEHDPRESKETKLYGFPVEAIRKKSELRRSGQTWIRSPLLMELPGLMHPRGSQRLGHNHSTCRDTVLPAGTITRTFTQVSCYTKTQS